MLQNETFRRNFKHSVDFRRDDGDDEDNQTRFLRISINGTKNLSHRSCPSINRKSNISLTYALNLRQHSKHRSASSSGFMRCVL